MSFKAALLLSLIITFTVPSFAGLERQVLASVLPIQNVEIVVHFLSQRLPLELALNLRRPEEYEPSPGDSFWTSDDILNSYAEQLNFKTAKAGRNDLYRAGSFILRQFHASSIPYAFRPPMEGLPKTDNGIWLEGFDRAGSLSSRDILKEMDEEDSDREESEGEEAEEELESEEDGAAEGTNNAIKSAFSLLTVEGEADETESEEEE